VVDRVIKSIPRLRDLEFEEFHLMFLIGIQRDASFEKCPKNANNNCSRGENFLSAQNILAHERSIIMLREKGMCQDEIVRFSMNFYREFIV
jgi:hypothetical protein